MRNLIIPLVAFSMTLTVAEAAMAQGHIAGGVAGAAVAGKHHRVAGAVIGGAVGHHIAKKNAAKKQAAAQNQPTAQQK